MSNAAPEPLKIIVCDDDDLIRMSVIEHLSGEGFTTIACAHGEQCLDALATNTVDAVMLDLHMPVLDGLGVLRALKDAGSRVPVLVLTSDTNIDSAIAATKLGAAAYLRKPFDPREVTLQLQRVLDMDRMSDEVAYLRARQRHYGQMVGASPPMLAVYDMLRRLEGVDAPTVLVHGESGTGKELVAQAIHDRGPRRTGPFVEIDCASLPDTLIESELFGHERGAFTDARQQKRGLFEVARGGTVFLDEIGEMPITTQAKLLRVLETRKMRRVGGTTDIAIDIGIVAATNRDLAKEADAGTFRRDLYYRLAVIPIALPPLRARTGDIAPLVMHFLDHFKKRIPGPLDKVAPDTLRALQDYNWPGNVRELKNVVERMVTLYRDEPELTVACLPPEVRFARPEPVTVKGGGRFILPPEGVDLDAVEHDFVVQALERTKGNQTAASKLLGLSRFALRNRIEKFGLKATTET